jgi:hypothetical protein
MPVSEFVPALDPEEACQKAIEAGLVVHRAHPLNGETSIPALIGGVVMPNAHFYVRNHFQIPNLDPAAFRLAVGGLVERPLNLSLRDLHNMPSQTLIVTLECAGNGRMKFHLPIEGEKWDLGAVSSCHAARCVVAVAVGGSRYRRDDPAFRSQQYCSAGAQAPLAGRVFLWLDPRLRFRKRAHRYGPPDIPSCGCPCRVQCRCGIRADLAGPAAIADSLHLSVKSWVSSGYPVRRIGSHYSILSHVDL